MIPDLKKQGTATQLIFHEKPFLVLGGELGNSSASDPAYIETIWPKVVAFNMNTVLAPVYWELLEPEEGHFDFALVDSLIHGARKHGVSLVLLWFGAWKNSVSCYAPLAACRELPRAFGAGAHHPGKPGKRLDHRCPPYRNRVPC